MKTATTFELRVAWWQKERPAALEKDAEARRFEACLKDLEQALAAAQRGTDGNGRAALEKLGEALEDSARKLVKIVDTLGKTAKGDDRKDLDNTEQALVKPLAAAIRTALEAVGGGDDGEDEEEDDSQFGAAEAHAAYLKQRLKRVKKAQMPFAVTMPTTEAVDLRLAFNPRKDGQSLGLKLKSACKGKKTTFGLAGTEDLVETVGSDESVASGTLVLSLDGAVIPGLAKRVRDMFRALGVKVFAKVKVLKDGQVVDAADADGASEPLPEVALTEDEGGAPVQTQATPGQRKPALALRLRELSGLVVSLPDKLREGVLNFVREAAGLLKAAGPGDDAPELDRAEKIISTLETRLGQMTGTLSSQRGEEAKAETPVGGTAFGKARLIWARTRTQVQAQVQSLVDGIIEACGDDPAYAEWRAEAPSLLAYAADLDGELEATLEALDLARTMPERQQLIQKAGAMIQAHLERLNDEFYAVAEGPTDLPTVQASLARNALAAIAKVVEQGARTPA
jgi:hypothetical protein